MHQITTPELFDITATNSDALDRLIIKDAIEYGSWDGDVLLSEDKNLALLPAALFNLLENQSTGRVFFRARSYALTQEAVHFKKSLSPELQNRVFIADQPSGIADFLHQHRFTGTLALGRLPKSHGALADWASDFSTYQLEQKQNAGCMILGGNTKHMSKTFNDTLTRSFADVQGLRGKGKNRCLYAATPQPTHQASTKTELVGLGGVFSGSKPDAGGTFLAEKAEEYLVRQDGQLTVLDFGCGNGSVSHQLLTGAAAEKIGELLASDIDADAVRSAQVNLAQFSQAQVVWDDAVQTQPESRFDLVLLNPPFHDGTRIDLTMVQPLLDSVARVLKPGGVLLLVHNSHARYRPEIERRFSDTKQVGRNRIFTVLSASNR